ncbi:YciI family protein [Acidovorax sp.]|uniref:YciI family protein n=1 Tax=Acidovorax sp. TaxID=1872122 RepID=UPI002ACE274E|nr:YciI family protein [Acidovorax sp.]MDZ7863120.1 YciI family protein [Acidovorax sp.]
MHNEYILLMHEDAPDRVASNDPEQWARYLGGLRATGQFDGGSEIGAGERLRKGQPGEPAARAIGGFIRVRAATLEEARQFLAGNPVYEAGGTVELRELPKS